MTTFVINNSQSHDLSCVSLNDGQISHFLMERFDRHKHSNSYKTLFKVVGETAQNGNPDFDFDLTQDDLTNHHLHHAFCGLLGSPFDDALVFVLDGAGSEYKPGVREVETVLHLSRNRSHRVIYKRFHTAGTDEFFSVGVAYEEYCLAHGFEWCDAGKIMGIAQYKSKEDRIKEDFIRSLVPSAYELQQDCTHYVINLLKNFYDKSISPNVIITGGYALNCVSNKQYLDIVPASHLHIDPICTDAGLSLGKAYRKYGIPLEINNTYLGWKEKYIDFENRCVENVSPDDVAKKLSEGHAIAVFQGASETGQRALGNRSLLFDPRNPGAKELLNKIKKREDYRPFACSILEEEADNFFDLKGMSGSPYMCYALDALPKALELMPGAIHADGTSRIQTVSQKNNMHFYRLIKSFEAQTGVPGLINTSFNLAGEPLIEKSSDAFKALDKSSIFGIYFPEFAKLVRNPFL